MPRYYRYGYQGPDYAALWTNQLAMPQSQAPGLRTGLGQEPGKGSILPLLALAGGTAVVVWFLNRPKK